MYPGDFKNYILYSHTIYLYMLMHDMCGTLLSNSAAYSTYFIWFTFFFLPLI